MSKDYIYNRLHEITTLFVKDIDACIEEFNKTFNKRKLINYIIYGWKVDKEYEEMLEYWNKNKSFKNYKYNVQNVKHIGYRLSQLADLIREITGISWMTFMVQDPQASDVPTEKNFLAFNYGMKKEMRESWEAEINKDIKMFTLTKLLFGKNTISDSIVCFRVNKSARTDDKLIFIDYDDINGKPNISLISSFSEKRDKLAKAIKEEIANYEAVQRYVEFMSKHSKLKKSFVIYAIPVITIFLYPSCPSRSGLYLVTDEEISTEKLFATQQIVTQTMCHIDYLRASIIQKRNDMRLFTHDLRGSLIYISEKIGQFQKDNLLERGTAKENIDLVRKQISFINALITGFQVNFAEELMGDFRSLVTDNNWIFQLSEFGRSLFEKWSVSEIIPTTKILQKNTLYKMNFDKKYDYEINGKKVSLMFNNILLTLILVMLRNAWKHQHEYCSRTEDWAKGIEIGIMEDLDKDRFVLITKNDTINTSIEVIEENKNNVQGTFAVAQLLTSILNEKFTEIFREKSVEIEVNYYLNKVKTEFIQCIYIPKEIF